MIVMGKVFGIISIKGGVGKTTTVTNLGAALADLGKNVLIVDGNFSAPNLGLHVGVVNPKKHIHGVIHHGHSLEDATHESEHGFDILPASLISRRKIDPKQFKAVINYVKKRYDIVLIDSSPSLNDEMLATMVASNELLVVTTPDFPTLSTTMRAIKIAKQKRTPITGLILNKVRYKKFELSLDDIEDATNTPVLAVLPDDVKVLESLAHSKPVVSHASGRRVAVGYKRLAASLIGEVHVPKETIFGKLKRFFSKDVDRDEVNRLLVEKDS
jgi:septum site-determining protein MinD